MRAGRGRLAVTGCWDGLLKQMARLPCADCLKNQSERAVGADRGRTSGRDGPLGWTFETNGTDSLRRLFQNSVRAGRRGGTVACHCFYYHFRVSIAPPPSLFIQGRGRGDGNTKVIIKTVASDCGGRAVDGRP